MHHSSQLCASQLPVVHAQIGKKSQKNLPPQPSIMVIIRQGNYMPDKNVTSISGDGNGGERQLPRRQLPRLLGQQPILPSPGITRRRPLQWPLILLPPLILTDNNGDGVGAGGKHKCGMDEEEMEEEAEEVDKAKEEGWQRLIRKGKSGISDDELHNYFHARLMGGGRMPQ